MKELIEYLDYNKDTGEFKLKEDKDVKLYCLEPSEARCSRCWKLRSKCTCGTN